MPQMNLDNLFTDPHWKPLSKKWCVEKNISPNEVMQHDDQRHLVILVKENENGDGPLGMTGVELALKAMERGEGVSVQIALFKQHEISKRHENGFQEVIEYDTIKNVMRNIGSRLPNEGTMRHNGRKMSLYHWINRALMAVDCYGSNGNPDPIL